MCFAGFQQIRVDFVSKEDIKNCSLKNHKALAKNDGSLPEIERVVNIKY